MLKKSFLLAEMLKNMIVLLFICLTELKFVCFYLVAGFSHAFIPYLAVFIICLPE